MKSYATSTSAKFRLSGFENEQNISRRVFCFNISSDIARKGILSLKESTVAADKTWVTLFTSKTTVYDMEKFNFLRWKEITKLGICAQNYGHNLLE